MNIQTLKPRLNPNFSDDVVRSPSWKNLYFSKTGECGYGCHVYSTQEEAKEKAKLFLDGFGEIAREDILTYFFYNGVAIKIEDFSHTFPIPWRE